MKRKAILFILILSLFALSCEKSIHKPLLTVATDYIVVDGVLTNQFIKHPIKLTHTYETLNAIPDPVTGATVTVTDDINVYALTESTSAPGEYYTPPMRVVTGRTYTLKIQYHENEYTAQDSAVPVEKMQAIEYHAVKDQFALTYKATGKDPHFITYNISWKNTALCTTGSVCEGLLAFYDLKTIDVNEIFKPDKTDFTFPGNSVIVRTKYSVSDAYKSFLRAMLSETEWRGGVFDIQRADVPTNLSKGALGFFAVSTVLSDTTVVK